MPHVFISHSTKNKKIAERICAVLERNGWQCWIAPRNVPPGYDWAESIVAAVRGSQLMITVVSQEAYRSKGMAHELELAETHSVPILPIRVDATPLAKQFAYFLGNTQWLDLAGRTRKDYEKNLVEAVSARSNGLAAAGRADVHTVAGEPRSVIETFVAGAMRREKALADLNLSDSRTLRLAFTILVCVSLVTAILHIPAWGAQGIRFGNPAFLPLAATDELIEQIAFCLLLYLAIRMFGGTADPRQFFSAFGSLGAYLLMSNLFLVPVEVRTIAVIRGAKVDELPIGDLAVIAAGGAAWFAFRIVFAVSLFRAFHITEQLGAAKSAMSFVTAIGMWILSVLVFSKPFETNLYKAFG